MRTLRLDILAAAAAITLMLIYAMQAMIQVTLQPDVWDPPTKIGPITMPPTEIEVHYPELVKPVKPVTKTQPQVTPIDPKIEINPTSPVITFPQPTTPTDIDKIGGPVTTGDMFPTFKVAAQYPQRALQLGIEAFVVVEFTVTATGGTRNVVVVDAVTTDGKPTSLFDRSSIAAAEKFRYNPRYVEGKAVDVHGVRNRFVFEMQK